MTNLNKLFTGYFIIAVAIVLLLTTLVSNFGALVFFRQYIFEDYAEKNESIVEVVGNMLANDELGKQSYPMLLGLISRQQKVNILLSSDDGETVFKSNIYRNDEKMPEFINLEYDLEGYTLIIGRARDPLYDISNARFIRTLNFMYIILFVLSMLIAVIMAMILAKRFNRPIVQLQENVNNISMNRFSKIKKPKTRAKELNELSEDIGRLAGQMEREDEMRKRLSNDIVHELKTPIAVLSTNIEAILDGVYKADEERMSVLLDQINRLTRLVNNLSDLTLIETDYENMKLEEISLSEIIDKIYMVYLPVADDRNIMLEKRIDDEVKIMGNRDRLLQVFVNVVSNAFKYTDNGGSINIRLQKNHGNAVCVVEDTGMGIAEKDIPFIFNRFYRGDESRSRETGGAGIGLSIAKSVISAHGGDIKVTSTIGEGTQISIILPEKV